jgi:hypothetical protein
MNSEINHLVRITELPNFAIGRDKLHRYIYKQTDRQTDNRETDGRGRAGRRADRQIDRHTIRKEFRLHDVKIRKLSVLRSVYHIMVCTGHYQHLPYYINTLHKRLSAPFPLIQDCFLDHLSRIRTSMHSLETLMSVQHYATTLTYRQYACRWKYDAH